MQLRDEGVQFAAEARVERGGRKVWGRRSASQVDVAARIDSDRAGKVLCGTAEVARIEQAGALCVNLRHECILTPDVGGGESTSGGREVRRGGRATHVRGARSVDRDAAASIVGPSAEVGRVDKLR